MSPNKYKNSGIINAFLGNIKKDVTLDVAFMQLFMLTLSGNHVAYVASATLLTRGCMFLWCIIDYVTKSSLCTYIYGNKYVSSQKLHKLHSYREKATLKAT